MLLITLVQVVCAATAVYFGAKAAMGFGRDVRSGIFHQVSDFSAREMGQFGAPSLITRITNDVQQVQMLVLMTCTLLVAAPITAIGGIIMAIREDGGLSWILTVSIPVLVICILMVVRRMVPQFRKMQERIDTRQPRAPRADHRHPRGARLRPRAGRGQALRRRQRRPHRHLAAWPAGCRRSCSRS